MAQWEGIGSVSVSETMKGCLDGSHKPVAPNRHCQTFEKYELLLNVASSSSSYFDLCPLVRFGFPPWNRNCFHRRTLSALTDHWPSQYFSKAESRLVEREKANEG